MSLSHFSYITGAHEIVSISVVDTLVGFVFLWALGKTEDLIPEERIVG